MRVMLIATALDDLRSVMHRPRGMLVAIAGGATAPSEKCGEQRISNRALFGGPGRPFSLPQLWHGLVPLPKRGGAGCALQAATIQKKRRRIRRREDPCRSSSSD